MCLYIVPAIVTGSDTEHWEISLDISGLGAGLTFAWCQTHHWCIDSCINTNPLLTYRNSKMQPNNLHLYCMKNEPAADQDEDMTVRIPTVQCICLVFVHQLIANSDAGCAITPRPHNSLRRYELQALPVWRAHASQWQGAMLGTGPCLSHLLPALAL